MKFIRLSGITFLLFFCFVLTANASDNIKLFTTKTNIEPNHNFTIRFNEELDYSTVNSKTISVKDEQNNSLLVSPIKGNDTKSVILKAPSSGYENGKVYTISISNSIKGANGKPLNQGVQMKFTVGSTYVEDIVVDIEDLEDQGAALKQIQVIKNNNIENIEIDWDYDNLQDLGDGYTYQLSGVSKDSNIEVNMIVNIDKNFSEKLWGNVTFDSTWEHGEEFKKVETLLSELEKKGKLDFRDLVKSHLKGSLDRAAIGTFYESQLNKFFDPSIEQEREISNCVSNLMTSRAFGDIIDLATNTKDCLNKIANYVDESIGISSMTGTWTMHVGNENIRLDLVEDSGKVTGTAVGYTGTAIINRVEGSVNGNDLTLTVYLSKEYFVDFMKAGYNISNPSKLYRGDSYYKHTAKIDLSVMSGSHSRIRFHRNGMVSSRGAISMTLSRN